MAFSPSATARGYAGARTRTPCREQPQRASTPAGGGGKHKIGALKMRSGPTLETRARTPDRAHISATAERRTGAAAPGAGRTNHSGQEKPFRTSAGMERTLGVCQAVEARTAPVGRPIVCVINVLTTATTRPSQSRTGAPDAP